MDAITSPNVEPSAYGPCAEIAPNTCSSSSKEGNNDPRRITTIFGMEKRRPLAGDFSGGENEGIEERKGNRDKKGKQRQLQCSDGQMATTQRINGRRAVRVKRGEGAKRCGFCKCGARLPGEKNCDDEAEANSSCWSRSSTRTLAVVSPPRGRRKLIPPDKEVEERKRPLRFPFFSLCA